MRRRDVITSVGASVTVGLAGCAGTQGGCRTPSDDIHEALPEGQNYDETAHTVEHFEDSEDAVQLLYARFRDPEDNLYVFRAVEWNSPDAARGSMDEFESRDRSGDLDVARLRVDEFTYEGVASGRDNVRSILSASPVLERDCVESGITWG